MDPRRRASSVIGPKVRQVGFVTPNAEPDGADKELANLGLTLANSPTPVMIPRPPPTVEIPHKAAEPVAVPSPSYGRGITDADSIPSAPIGSYNSADPVLDGSSSLSSSKAGLLLPLSSTYYHNSY